MEAKKLTYRYMMLPYRRRIQVAQELGLIEESDEEKHGIEQCKRFLQRAKERHILEKLWDKVNEPA